MNTIYTLREMRRLLAAVAIFALVLTSVQATFIPIASAVGEISLTNISGTGTGPYDVSGIWSTVGNQPCYNSGQGGQFRYKIEVYRDIGDPGYDSGDEILQLIDPAPCENGFFSGTANGNQNATNEPWPAQGQSASPSTFTLDAGEHMICAALKHVSDSGNDIQASDCLDNTVVVVGDTANLTIAKDVDGDPINEWQFDFTSDIPDNLSFSLDELATSEDFGGDLAVGTYTITEADGGDDWELTDLSCTGTDDWSDQGGGELTVTLDADEDVTCTFTNTYTEPVVNDTATITIVKAVEVEGGASLPADWSFDFTHPEGSQFTLDDENTETTLSGEITGEHNFSEDTPLPTDWYLTDVTCVGTDSWSETSGDLTVTLVDQDDVTCTFTNTYRPVIDPDLGSISGTKYASDTQNGLQDWTIFIDENNNQTLDDGEESVLTDGDGDYLFSNLADGGPYSVCEVMKVGWEQIEPDTANGCHEVTIYLGSDSINNDFRNRSIQSIIVRKEVTAGSDQDTMFEFEFTSFEDNSTSSFELSHNSEDWNSGELTAGESYGITEENIPDYWSPEGVTCTSNQDDDQINPGDFLLEEGEVITCVFTNDQELFEIWGYVWDDEDEDGNRDEGEDPLSGWTVRANADGESQRATTSDETGFYHLFVPAGTWTVSEVVQGGWDQTFPVADDGTHIVVVPQLEVMNDGGGDLFASVFSFFIPTVLAQTPTYETSYGPYDFGNDEDSGGGSSGGGGGGSSSPRCDVFEADIDGDEIVLSWETRRGSSMVIEADGDEIYSETDDDIVDDGSLTIDDDGQEEFELVVSRGSRDDSCTVDLDRPAPQVLGEQVSVVPLGAANAGAGGAAPVELPHAPFVAALLATSRRIK